MIEDTINNNATISSERGTLLIGRYRVVRQLGQGGMGSVWLAEDMQLDGKLFAIKMLPSILVANKRAYRQLKDEALVAMKLTHPNIVTLRAFEENDGNPFLVMDYIDGQTLDDYLAEKGKLSEDETVKLLKPIAIALDYAHGEGVVHRDVKPANIMIRKDGHPFILDFGISREIQETMTRVTGKLSSGTILYMSPEQLNGDPPRPAQDVYSFAAMVYECLKGEPPFVRGAIEDQIKNKIPEPLRCGDALAAGIMSGLAKKSEDRSAICAAVLDGGFQSGAAVTQSSMARTPVEPQPFVGSFHPCDRSVWCEATIASRPKDRKGAGKVIAVLAFLAVFVGGAWWWQTRHTSAFRVSPASRVPQVSVALKENTGPSDGECRWFTLPGGVKMEMVYVAPGSFQMGSNSGGNNEKPMHLVHLTNGYWIGKYQVTQLQWKDLVSANNISFADGDPVPFFSCSGKAQILVPQLDTDDFPMEGVSWEDCDTLVKELNRRALDGMVISLPTEAQWEFAARGGNKSRGYAYSGGNDVDALGWYYENSGIRRLSDNDWKVANAGQNKCRSHSVREKDIGNELGVVGMSGNVFEWCSDWYDENYYRGSAMTEPQGPESSSLRVLRGGSFANTARGCRISARGGANPNRRLSCYGLRLCCDRVPDK